MRILVVDDSDDRGLAVMAGTDCTVIGPARSSAALRDLLKREGIDVVIASMSSPDRDTLESKAALTDRKVVERAKGVLMQQRGLSEPGAYALLRKTAMAQNRKIADVAKSILSVVDLLKA